MNMLYRTALAFASAGLLLLAPLAYAAPELTAAQKAQAKVTEAEAKATALAKIPNGVVKSSNLEMEKGRLVWSFDIARPDSKDITEIQIDAKTGKIVSVEKETPAQEAKEAKPAKPAGK